MRLGIHMRTVRQKLSRSAASVGALAAAWLLWGCAGQVPGRRLHTTSTEYHEAAAALEEHEASASAAQYHPGVEQHRRRCRSQGRGGGLVCSTAVVNPTEKHLRDAAEHRRRAAEHRAIARALRDAEAQ